MLAPMSAPEYATLTSDDLVTGEAVALDLPPAGVASRIASGLIDVIVTSILLVIVIFLLTAATLNTDDALLWVAFIGSLIVVFVVVPTTVETLTRGKSLGKLVVGLRTVRDDAGPIAFQHAFVRSLIAIVEVYAFGGGPAFFSALLSQRGKRLGDHAAGTYVVRERVTLRLAPPPQMPRHLAGWAAQADLASLPTPLALGIRQFLGRACDLDPVTRAGVGQRLADQVGPYVAPAPPTGTPREEYLRAVIAARRDRDRARLAREAQLRQRLTGRT